MKALKIVLSKNIAVAEQVAQEELIKVEEVKKGYNFKEEERLFKEKMMKAE